MEPLAAAMFLVGLMSGVHCAGMCGGIVIAFSTQPILERRALWKRQLALHLGRITTYALAGAAAGGVGAAAAAAAFPAQQAMFVLANVMLVLVGLQLAGVANALAAGEKLGAPLWRRVQPFAASLMRANPFAAGLVWGLIPCGLVYAALAVSTIAGGPLQGAVAMLAFGVGTLPWLLAAGVALAKLRSRLSGARARLAAGGIVLSFGLWGLAHAGAPAQNLKTLLCL